MLYPPEHAPTINEAFKVEFSARGAAAISVGGQSRPGRRIAGWKRFFTGLVYRIFGLILLGAGPGKLSLVFTT